MEADPYNHPKSIHALPGKIYPKSESKWITHISYQGYDPENIAGMILNYKKPVILDASGYEGNLLNIDWGNLTAEECTRRCWVSVINGGYYTHGESYTSKKQDPFSIDNTDGLFFWKGGVLSGESYKRMHYLKNIIDERLTEPLINTDKYTARAGNNFILTYFGNDIIIQYNMDLPKENYKIDIIDTWGMTVISSINSPGGKVTISLPSQKYLAISAYKY